MTYIKICGLRSIEHAHTAASAGADMLGFVFAPSKRRIIPAEAAAIIAAVRSRVAHAPQMVGLFVNEPAATIAAIVQECQLDAIQLSGNEPVALLDELPKVAIFKAIRLAGAAEEAGWLATAPAQATLMIDAHQPGSYGGTGTLASWPDAAAIARTRPLLLAGGLTAENVGAAIAAVQPWGVDVSTGVERDGQKDHDKIRAFVAAARSAETAQI